MGATRFCEGNNWRTSCGGVLPHRQMEETGAGELGGAFGSEGEEDGEGGAEALCEEVLKDGFMSSGDPIMVMQPPSVLGPFGRTCTPNSSYVFWSIEFRLDSR